MQKTVVNEIVQNITRKLLEAYRPQKVILFGSAAKPGNTEVNDLDFFIVKDGIPKRSIDRIRQIRSLVDNDVAVDFLIVTGKELRERQTMEDPFIMDILNRGKTLYG